MTKNRVLGRMLARPLTRKEIERASGGGVTRACICPDGFITDFNYEIGYICDPD